MIWGLSGAFEGDSQGIRREVPTGRSWPCRSPRKLGPFWEYEFWPRPPMGLYNDSSKLPGTFPKWDMLMVETTSPIIMLAREFIRRNGSF